MIIVLTVDGVQLDAYLNILCYSVGLEQHSHNMENNLRCVL